MKKILIINIQFIKVIMIMFLFFVHIYASDTKYEKEYRIKEKDVPDEALKFIKSLGFEDDVKWYFDEDLKENSIEAKIRHNKRKYSIEFDTIGKIRDVEIEMEWRDLPDKVRKMIMVQLDSVFDSHKVGKIQIQYSGDKKVLKKLIKGQKTDKYYLTQYEIITDGQKDKKWHSYQITFSDNGQIVKISQIIFRNIDNLEF